MTPPWLREHEVFTHGPSTNISEPLTRCSLPKKNQVRESGQKNLAHAIIGTWIQREKIVLRNLKCMTS